MKSRIKKWCSIIEGKRVAAGEEIPLEGKGKRGSLSSIEKCLPEQMNRAVESSLTAFSRMKRMSSWERREILERARAGVEQRAEELAALITEENGKPIRLSREEVRRCVETFRLSAQVCERLEEGKILPLDLNDRAPRGRTGYLRSHPLGPILGITPFNFPLNLVAHKVGPALAAGNSIVIKPSLLAPGPAVRLCEILLEAGLPAGACNVILAEGHEIDPLVFDNRFRMISFTGSAAVGWGLKAKSGRKRVTLELGGNAAAIVHEDADLNHALDRCAAGAFGYMGQVCISLQRLYVHRSILVSFAKRLTERVLALREGDPWDELTEIAPLISEAAAERVERWVHEAIAKGARVLCGGPRQGEFYPATLLTDVDPACSVYSEEVFGPVLILEGYDDFDEAIAKVNASRYGLQAGIFTRDARLINHAFESIETGTVLVNESPAYRSDAMPYGGVKESGFGREGVLEAARSMMEERLLVMDRSETV